MTSLGEAPVAGDERHPVDLRCSALVFRGQSVLLCRRTDEGGTHVLPGGTPRPGESLAVAAAREVREETGLKVSTERIAFVLETNSWDGQHLIELVFLGHDLDPSSAPHQSEDNLVPAFVALDDLDTLTLMPPLAGYIRGFPKERSSQVDWQLATAPWLGNLWRAAY